MASALTWITNEAKRLRKKYPKRFEKWTEYVAEASAIYAKKHGGKSPVGKKRVASVRTNSRTHTDKNRITANIQVGSIDAHKRIIRNKLDEQLSKYMLLHYYGNKKEKKQHAKKIRELKKQLRKYQ